MSKSGKKSDVAKKRDRSSSLDPHEGFIRDFLKRRRQSANPNSFSYQKLVDELFKLANRRYSRSTLLRFICKKGLQDDWNVK